jgi:protein-tyrosine phosphatase
VRVVYDLRGEPEREAAPSVLPATVRCESLPIGGDAARTSAIPSGAEARTDPGDITEWLPRIEPTFLAGIYEAMSDAAAPTFGRLIRALAEPDGTPALIHCHAGKDRTGLAVAFMLAALGVEESVILKDYELSAVHYTEPEWARQEPKLVAAGITYDQYRLVFGAERETLDALLARLRARHGSIEGYLADAAGVDDAVIAALRAQLVEEPA